MENASVVGEVLDNTHDIGHPAGHTIAGEWAADCTNLFRMVCKQTSHPCRYLLPHLGPLVDIHVLLDLPEGTTGAKE